MSSTITGKTGKIVLMIDGKEIGLCESIDVHNDYSVSGTYAREYCAPKTKTNKSKGPPRIGKGGKEKRW